MELRTCPVGPFAMNAYVLVCPMTNQSVLVDPGDEPTKLMKMLQGTAPVAILITHTHHDHIGALETMQHQLQIPVMAHRGPHVAGVLLKADRYLEQDDTVHVGHHTLLVHHTPGHTEDMLCFQIMDDTRILVGDTIFDGGPGKTWSTEDFAVTLYTLRTVIMGWANDTICYPGHGPSFRLGDRKEAIESFLSKDHGDFFGDATWNMG